MKKLMNKILYLSIGMSFIFTPIISIADENNKTVSNNINIERISGKDRYETSYNVSNYIISKLKSPRTVVLASGEGYADSLSGGNLASEFNAPLILIRNNKDTTALTDYLYKNRLSYVYAVGGEKSISNEVLNSISKYHTTNRISGKDRYETAANTYRYILDKRGIYNMPDLAAVYNGYKYTDALAATPFIHEYNLKSDDDLLPLLPVDKNIKEAPMKIIFGGKDSLPYANADYILAGNDRYKTAVEVAKSFKTILNKNIDTIVVTNGEDFPDALCSGPLASELNAAILLTKSDKINSDTMEYIKSNPNIKNIIIVGGENSVSKNAENELRAIRN